MPWMNSECPSSFRNTSELALITSDAHSQGTILTVLLCCCQEILQSCNIIKFSAEWLIDTHGGCSEQIFSEVCWLVREMMGRVTCSSHDAWQGIHDTIYHHHLAHFSCSLTVLQWCRAPRDTAGSCWHCSCCSSLTRSSAQPRGIITHNLTLIILFSYPKPSQLCDKAQVSGPDDIKALS